MKLNLWASAALILTASAASEASALNAITAIAEPIATTDQINADTKYILHNTGRNTYFFENPYGDLKLGAAPALGCDAGLNYTVSITPDADGLFTISTRSGRYVPEVGNGAVLTVGKTENAGHFTITKAANGHFVIANSINTAYGFDGNETSFVGWNAGQGTNCFYDIIPVSTGMGDYPLESYTEPDGGDVVDPDNWAALNADDIYLTWASKDENYARRAVPQLRMAADTTVYVWRGERAAVKALAFAAESTGKLNVKLGDWLRPDGTVAADASAGQARWMRYVITDAYNTCGTHTVGLPTWTVADVIDLEGPAEIEGRSVRPVWCTLEVPRDIEAGAYNLTLTLSEAETGKAAGELNLTVQVADRTLPETADWKFHLDLWQQPYSISRYYGVDRWSNAHFEAMRPYMEMLARAGQKVISAILFHEPWGDQSHDKFDPMVETSRDADGKWHFDYSIFDRWVEFMMSCGINERINCFSMIPWDMSFRYIDEATDTYQFLRTSTSSDEYRDLWTSFLTDFAAHLREKGWFDKTRIAMDERGLSAMIDAANLVRETVPEFKMALAGNYHAELVDLLDDYCLAFNQRFSADELARRKAAGQISTIYTCCTEARPNLFTNSLPAEAAYLPIQAIASGTDGYLHWSWINWPEQPLTDSRFRLFASGDTYLFYPGPRSSVRFERMIEGIQQTEKVRILKQKWTDEGNSERLADLDRALEQFVDRQFDYYRTAAAMVNLLESILNDGPATLPGPTDYCPAMPAEANKDIALANRWLTEASTSGCETELTYSASQPSETGAVTTSPIAVMPGSQFTLNLKPATNYDDIRYCRIVAAADWNRDFMFNALHDEILMRAGSQSTANPSLLDLTIPVQVPQTATPGLSLMRVCYADAWFDEPELCGELPKGFAFDIPMQILDPEQDAATEIRSDNSLRWVGDTLHSPAPVSIDVFSTSGALLHSARSVRSFSLRSFTPGLYQLMITFADGTRNMQKRINR